MTNTPVDDAATTHYALFIAHQAGFPPAVIDGARELAVKLRNSQAQQITSGDSDDGDGGSAKCYASSEMHLRLKGYYALVDALLALRGGGVANTTLSLQEIKRRIVTLRREYLVAAAGGEDAANSSLPGTAAATTEVVPSAFVAPLPVQIGRRILLVGTTDNIAADATGAKATANDASTNFSIVRPIFAPHSFSTAAPSLPINSIGSRV